MQNLKDRTKKAEIDFFLNFLIFKRVVQNHLRASYVS